MAPGKAPERSKPARKPEPEEPRSPTHPRQAIKPETDGPVPPAIRTPPVRRACFQPAFAGRHGAVRRDRGTHWQTETSLRWRHSPPRESSTEPPPRFDT